MKLVPWLLALHSMAIALSSGMAIVAECDGDKLRPFCLAFMITGWVTAFLSMVFLILTWIGASRRRTRDIVLLILLLLIGLQEARLATQQWEVLGSLTGSDEMAI